MKKWSIAKFLANKVLVILSGAALTVVLVAVLGIFLWATRSGQKPAVVDTISTLEKVVKLSDLSTYTAIYNGIATVTDPEDAEKIQYHVAYRAQVNAGLDFADIQIEGDTENAQLIVTLPEIRLDKAVVDVASLEYIFMDNKANQSTITAEALKACQQDVDEESKKQQAILELAEQNAQNVLQALMEPMLEQDLPDYQLVFAGEEEQS